MNLHVRRACIIACILEAHACNPQHHAHAFDLKKNNRKEEARFKAPKM